MAYAMDAAGGSDSASAGIARGYGTAFNATVLIEYPTSEQDYANDQRRWDQVHPRVTLVWVYDGNGTCVDMYFKYSPEF